MKGKQQEEMSYGVEEGKRDDNLMERRGRKEDTEFWYMFSLFPASDQKREYDDERVTTG